MLAPARLALGYLTPGERARYFVLLAIRALTGLLDVFGIALIGLIAGVAATQLSSAGGSTPSILGIHLPRLSQVDLLLLVVAVLVVFVIKAVIALLMTRIMTVFIARIETENAQKIADLILRGSLDSVKRYSIATLQYAVTGSTTSIFSGILNNIATIVSEGFLLVIVVATFFFVNPIAAIFTLVYFTIVVVLIQVVIGGVVKRAGRTSAQAGIDTTNAISDSLHTFREISVLGKEGHFLDRFHHARSRLSGSAGVFAFLGGMPRYVVETSLMLGVVVFVGQQFLSGQLGTGIVTIGVFLTGGVRIMASLLPLQAAFTTIKQNQYQGELAEDLLGQVRAIQMAPVPPALAVEVPRDRALAVLVDGVRYRYPDDESGSDVLRDVSLEIEAGSHVAIIGPSGAGKTTLVDLMLGLVIPDAGSVEIGGVEPNRLRRSVPGLISYVPQKPGLVTGTIAENVALGNDPRNIDRGLLQRALEAAHLAEFIDGLPDGADTSVGNQTDALSGGQIQRIGLARALYAQPRLLILDEATSALDAGSEAYIAEGLRRLHGDVTVIIIAHRLSTVQHSDVVHVVQEGRITASGKFNQLRRDVPMVAEYVKLMSFDDD